MIAMTRYVVALPGWKESKDGMTRLMKTTANPGQTSRHGPPAYYGKRALLCLRGVLGKDCQGLTMGHGGDRRPV